MKKYDFAFGFDDVGIGLDFIDNYWGWQVESVPLEILLEGVSPPRISHMQEREATRIMDFPSPLLENL